MICDVASGAVPVLFMLLIRTVFVSSNTGNKQLTLFSVKKIYSEYIFSRKLSTDFVQIGSLDREMYYWWYKMYLVRHKTICQKYGRTFVSPHRENRKWTLGFTVPKKRILIFRVISSWFSSDCVPGSENMSDCVTGSEYKLFERSEFLIDTSQKKSLRVCTRAVCTRARVFDFSWS